jgi:hypothetical protein
MNNTNTDILNIITSKTLNVLIYPHLPFNLSDGGTTVHYYLAQVLDNMGLTVKICNEFDNNSRNSLFNKFTNKKNIDIDNTIVIYCEGIKGNPLNAKYVVRWMLSKLGQNVPLNYYNYWGPNELVYFFNSEKEFLDSNTQVKMLTLFYINPNIRNLNLERKGTCHSFRKKFIHNNVTILHKPASFEITREHTQNDYIEIFNKYKQFLCYDPLSFLSIIAAMCGCISIIYPIEGVSKKEYFKKTGLYEYMVDKNICEIYGIAYGASDEEINYSRDTLHLVKEQFNDIQNWFINKYIKNFISDIYNWNNNINTLISYKDIMIQDLEFDVNFYKTYQDLNHMSSEELINHYEEYGKKENRIASKYKFDKLYPDFDLENYTTLNSRFKSEHMPAELLNHYHNFGSKDKEERLIQANFDVNFYKTYQDLKHMSSEELINHYKTYGKKENRIASEKKFYELYPDFDIENYTTLNQCFKSKHTPAELLNHYHNFGSKDKEERLIQANFDPNFYKTYQDLKHMSSKELINHYEKYGKKENRIASKYKFDKLYPDFDIEFYKAINPELNDHSYTELLNYYHNNNNINLNSEYDFVVNDDYTVSNLNSKTYELIYNTYYIRTIDTYEKLVQYRKQFEKKKIIYNKKSFYKYYSNFDYEYYKNIHFKDNNDISEQEILLHYHQKGKNNNIDNKTKIILYIPPYDIKCGGITVLHYFAKLINEKYNEKHSAKIFMYNNIKYKNPFCNDFAQFDDITDDTIVIYPEIVSGNPLNAKRVVRWILLELGIEMPLDHYKKWNKTDLIYHWEKIDKQLACPFFNNIFTNKNQNNRNKTCYLVKKGPIIHKKINYIHPNNSICIDNLSLSQISNIFNECKYFYTYDPNSAYVIYSAVCGCIPIICKIDGVNEDEYFKSKMYNFNDQIYNKGIVYGNNLDKINYIIKNKLNENNEEYYRNLFKIIEEQTIPLFLNDILHSK